MDSTGLSALAGLAGASIGGFTSFAASWLTQQAQATMQNLTRSNTEREALYRQFIEEASVLHVDALMHDTADVPKLIGLYSLISSMRLLSTPRVVATAEELALTIIDTYAQPNKTLPEVRDMMEDGSVDPLKAFSGVCREELRALEANATSTFARSFVGRRLENLSRGERKST